MPSATAKRQITHNKQGKIIGYEKNVKILSHGGKFNCRSEVNDGGSIRHEMLQGDIS
jgi:hypothetical protein